MGGNVDASLSQRDKVGCGMPTSKDKAPAEMAGGPTMRFTMRDRNRCEYCGNQHHSIAPWRTCGEPAPPMGGAIPEGDGIRLRPADASHRLGPRSLIETGDNYAATGGNRGIVSVAVRPCYGIRYAPHQYQ